MTPTNKLIGFMIITLTATQIVVIYLEGTSLLDPGFRQERRKKIVKRIIYPADDETISGKYLVNRFYKSEGYGLYDVNPNDVTMTLHGKVDDLYQLVELSRLWSGPISMAIFAPGLDAGYLDDAIDGLRLCWSVVRKNVIFHVVYPETMTANMTQVGSFVYLSCKDILRRLKHKKTTAFWGEAYPRSVMRNVAHSSVITDWILDLDSNLFPTQHLRKRFLSFLEKWQRNKTSLIGANREVFVLPAFEVRRNSNSIDNKTQLLQSLQNKDARSYMQEICPRCHKPINYDKWTDIEINHTRTDLNVCYSVRYTPEWEPFFIAPRTSPNYDERITSSGLDRLFLMCKLQSLNYKFILLNDEFLLHYGYLSKEKHQDDSNRFRRENFANFRRKFNDLLKLYNYTKPIYKNCYF